MRVFIAGSGLMGCGIAVAIATKYNVLLYDISREAIERAAKMVSEVSAQLGVEVEVNYTQNFDDASEADIFIEAVPESDFGTKLPHHPHSKYVVPQPNGKQSYLSSIFSLLPHHPSKPSLVS